MCTGHTKSWSLFLGFFISEESKISALKESKSVLFSWKWLFFWDVRVLKGWFLILRKSDLRYRQQEKQI